MQFLDKLQQSSDDTSERQALPRRCGSRRHRAALGAGTRRWPGSAAPSTHHPPSRAMPSDAGVVDGVRAQSVGSSTLTCGGVHPRYPTPACPGTAAWAWAVASPVGELLAALADRGGRGEPLAVIRATARAVEVAGHRHDPLAHRSLSNHVQRVTTPAAAMSATSSSPTSRPTGSSPTRAPALWPPPAR